MIDALPQWLVLTYVAVVGGTIGSFLNVVIARLPAGESLVRPRSRCPRCQTPIRWYDNIPVVSYLALRGRCRACGARISARYPLVEVLMAALALALWLRLGPSWELALWAPLAAAFLAIVFLDIDHYWVPDVITYPALALALLASFLPGGLGPLDALVGLVPALGLWAFAIAFAWITGREGMGFGDIKLLAVIGLALGAFPALLVLLWASVQGSIAGAIVLFAGGHRSVGSPAGDEGDTAQIPVRDPQSDEGGDAAKAPAAADAGDGAWVPHPRAIPFGPFLVLGCYEVLLLPELFVEGPLRLMRFGE